MSAGAEAASESGGKTLLELCRALVGAAVGAVGAVER